jgi:hypothetical protein
MPVDAFLTQGRMLVATEGKHFCLSPHIAQFLSSFAMLTQHSGLLS